MPESEKKSKEQVERDFYTTLTQYFSQRWLPKGLSDTVAAILDQLNTLNKNLAESNKSSLKLAETFDKLIFWIVIIAGAGVLVSLGHLLFEIYKYSM